MELHERIINEAGKLFVEKGIRQVTMDMIAQAMGISKRTIYENFKDKNELVGLFLREAIIEHKKRAFEIMARADNVIEALFGFGEYNEQSVRKVHPCFFSDIKKYHPIVFREVMGAGEVRNYEITFMILKRGIDEGIFLPDLDIDIANLFIHHAFDFFQKIEERNFDHSRIWYSVFFPYLKGICTEKGRSLIALFETKVENLKKK
ncbi:MAG TPA: TetR/AcrR family transcriptional regulator [Prolixibacteraceae bacterium]|nr:TetR/AcrR family transcriptional regulator [Prolixibacteraceae bacterium]